VSETQLADGHAPDVKYILVSNVGHIPDAAVKGLRDFIHRGGTVLFLGDGNLKYDEYHRPRNLPVEFEKIQSIPLDKSVDVLADRLRPLIGTPEAVVDAASGKSVAGLEYTFTQFECSTLVTLLNTHRPYVTVRLPDRITNGFDILNEEPIDPKAIRLDPMVPRLIRCANK
jgi:hypothetical protein